MLYFPCNNLQCFERDIMVWRHETLFLLDQQKLLGPASFRKTIVIIFAKNVFVTLLNERSNQRKARLKKGKERPRQDGYAKEN